MLYRSELLEWFPDDELLIVPEPALPEELSDVPTRRLLSEVGMPESFLDVLELDAEIVEGMPRVDEIYRKYDEQAPAGTEELFYLGFAGQPFLTIDGRSGEVHQVHREFGARPLAGSLESFLRVLGVVSGAVRKHRRERKDAPAQFAERLSADVFTQLRREDPRALPAAEPAWRALLADIVAAAA